MRTFFLAPDGRLRPSWRFWLAVVVFIAAHVAGSVGTLFASAILAPFWETHSELLYRALTTLFLLAGFSGLLYLFDREGGNPLARMGLGVDGRWFRECLVGICLGAAMVALAVVSIAVLGGVQFRWIGGGRPTGVLMWAVALQLLVLAVAALLEEVAFRGYPFQRLVEGLGPVPALIILNSLFSLVHLGNPYASFWSIGTLNTVAIGIVLGVAYLRTRALWLPWGIHFGWNATLGVAFGLPVSGTLQFQTVIAGAAEGPLWLTGGGYGIEASATGAVVILLGLAGVVGLTPLPPAPTLPSAEATAPPASPASIPQQ